MMVQIVKIKKWATKILAMSLMAIAVYSCVDDWDMKDASFGMVWNPKLAFTIGTTTFKLADIIHKLDTAALTYTDKEGLIYLIYEKNLPTFSAELQITLPTQNNIDFVFPITGVIPASGVLTATIPMPDIDINFNADQEINSMVLKEMIVNLTGTSTFTNDGELIVEFPNIVNIPKPSYSDTFNIPKNSSISETRPNKADGYIINFKTTSIGKSSMPINLTFSLKGNPGDIISAGQKITLTMTVVSLKYHKMVGYIGKYSLLDESGSLNFPALNQFIAKGIQFYNPKLYIYTQNSYSLPVQLYLDKMALHSTISNTVDSVHFFNSPKIVNPDSINYPIFNDPIKVALDTLIYSKVNPRTTDAFDFFYKAPDSLSYRVTLTSNPNGKTTVNTLYDTSSVKTKIRVELPLWFKSDAFGDTTSMAFDLGISSSDTAKSNTVKSMLFRTITENSLPVDLRLQVYFMDSVNNVLDSLYKDNSNLVASGKVGASDLVIAPTKSVKDVKFNSNQLKSIEKTKKLFIKVSLKTGVFGPPSTGYVKFLSSSYLKLSFACQFEIKTKL